MWRKIWGGCITVAVSTVGSVLATLIVSFLCDLLKKYPLFTTIKSVWLWIIPWLNLELKVWWVLLGSVVIIAILYVIKSKSPAYRGYREDVFMGFKWSWDWEWSPFYEKWMPLDLKPHCPDPECDTPMEHCDWYNNIYRCPRCLQKEFPLKQNILMVEDVIRDNIKRKKYKTKL